MLVRMQRKRTTFALLVEMQTGAATLENSMEVPEIKKIKIEIPYDLTIALLVFYPKDTKIYRFEGVRAPQCL